MSMKELSASKRVRAMKAAIDPVSQIGPRLGLRKETIMTVLLLKEVNGRSSSTSAHCF